MNVYRQKLGGVKSETISPVVAWLLILTLCFLSTASCGNNRSFDSAAWRQADQRTRGRMSENLMARKLLIGQPATEAQRLLGAPTKEYASLLVYDIDMGLPFKGPNPNGLQVHLDANRNVREVRIVD